MDYVTHITQTKNLVLHELMSEVNVTCGLTKLEKCKNAHNVIAISVISKCLPNIIVDYYVGALSDIQRDYVQRIVYLARVQL